MGLELYWGSGSPYAWRVLLALEYKRLEYASHLLEFAKLEHKSPAILKLNPRGRVPILKDTRKDGSYYVCFESVAILHYLDRKYPAVPIFGTTAEETGTIMRAICEYQAYVEEHIVKIVYAIFFQGVEARMDEVGKALQTVANEARTLEGRLTTADWLAMGSFSAADIVIFPGIKLLLRALERREAQDLRSRLLPQNYPAIARWVRRVESLPGYERTYPPHWREATTSEPVT